MKEFEVDSRKQPTKLPFVVFITLLLGIPLSIASFNAISNRWSSAHVSMDSEVTGIYIQPDIFIPEELRMSELISVFEDVEFTNRDNSSFYLASLPESLIDSETRLLKSEMVYREVAVPIMKFASTNRNMSKEVFITELTAVEDSIFENYSNLKGGGELLSLSCDAIKDLVNQNDTYALVSSDCLDGTVSVPFVDDVSIFGRVGEGYDLEDYENWLDEYPFKSEIWANYEENENTNEILEYISSFYSNSNEKLETHSIVMTGVTAMGRTVVQKIQEHGTSYPIEKVASVTSSADIAHTSNEVSFYSPCEQPAHTLSFCALPESIDTLVVGGFDIIELTGNHNNDRGSAANLASMELYEENGMQYVGGGKNIEDAYTVRYTDIGDYKVGWVGFNAPGPSYAWATETTAGAAEYFEENVIELVSESAKNADMTITVIQWANENYSYPTEFQKESARLAIDNGADIVVGSQGHGTLKMEFYNGKPIYYGLGNFMFDQMFSDKVREGVILRINTLNGEIANMELLPYAMEDYCQPNFVYGDHAKSVIDGVVVW